MQQIEQISEFAKEATASGFDPVSLQTGRSETMALAAPESLGFPSAQDLLPLNADWGNADSPDDPTVPTTNLPGIGIPVTSPFDAD